MAVVVTAVAPDVAVTAVVVAAVTDVTFVPSFADTKLAFVAALVPLRVGRGWLPRLAATPGLVAVTFFRGPVAGSFARVAAFTGAGWAAMAVATAAATSS